MKSIKYKLFYTALILFFALFSKAEIYSDVTVAKDGSGDFKTITEAINSIPSDNFQRWVIFVKNGTYHEKIRIEQNYVTILGESRENTIIQYEQLKKAWTTHKDFEGPAVVNIHADDVILDNLTIQNTMPEIGPNAYVIHGTGTRTLIQNCNILNNGANTVSLMDYKTGMYYLNNCLIEGTVDFMRAMGWCYLNNCHFFQKEAIASVWHAGITDRNQKMVIKNSSFDGVEHFFLGRHHYDAQLFLINCRFTEKLADKPIYQKDYPKNPAKEKPYIYGDRHYYYDCQKEGGNYAWLANNLHEYAQKIKPEQLTSGWTFDGKWQPESDESPALIQTEIVHQQLFLEFDQPLTVRGAVVLETATGKKLEFYKGKGRSTLIFTSEKPLSKKDLKGKFKILSGTILASTASSNERFIPALF